MRVPLALVLLLSAAPARADRSWAVEPDQALVTLDAAPFSAFSHRLAGELREVEGGRVHLELRLPLRSLTTGDAAQDRGLPREGEMAFDLAGPGAAKDGALNLEGTVTFQGVSRPVHVRLGVVHTDKAVFGHALLFVHLREFGYPLPPGMRDAARIELDAALQPERSLASRG